MKEHLKIRPYSFAYVVLAASILALSPALAAQTPAKPSGSETDLTPGEIAANGPLPGDVSLYLKELACEEERPTPGYYSSLNGAELTDAERSGLFSCATFTGS